MIGAAKKSKSISNLERKNLIEMWYLLWPVHTNQLFAWCRYSSPEFLRKINRGALNCSYLNFFPLASIIVKVKGPFYSFLYLISLCTKLVSTITLNMWQHRSMKGPYSRTESNIFLLNNKKHILYDNLNKDYTDIQKF